MKRIEALLRHRYAPLFLLGLTGVLAYGLVVSQTGFYWDDLPMSWIRYELGPRAMTEYFSTNRPVWGWLYQLTTRLLPQVPVYWQLFALLWRLVCAALVWMLGRELWPQRGTFAVALGLLFLVYPGFNAQWTAYLFSHFFIVLAFFLFSLLCSLLSLRLRSPAWLVAGLLFSALNLWMMEYFFVLELARFAILWVALRDRVPDARSRTAQAFKYWLPYLALFGLAVLSRLFIFNNQVYGFGLLPRLRADFAGTLVELLRNIVVSLATVTLQSWTPALQVPDTSIYGPRTLLLYVGVVIVSLLVTLAWLGFQPRDMAAHARWEGGWFVGLGLLMLPFAGAPFWLIGLPVALSFPANRATIPAMLPVAFIVAGLVELVRPARLRDVLLVLLVALAAGRQFLWGTDFVRDWDKQRNLFWQMTWRAPGLQPDTMVLMNDGAFNFYADNSLGAALNWVYAPDLRATGSIPYLLFYPTNRLGGSLPGLEPGQVVAYDYLVGNFQGSTSQVVSFYYLPPACLRLLDPLIDGANRFLSDRYMMRDAAALSSAQWITPGGAARMPAIYGPEPAQAWCFYFEKADLARQQGDWQQVAALGDRAFSSGDYPNDPVERFVFVEGYAHTGDWAKALEYSTQSHRVSPDFVDPMLCRLWDRIDQETISSPEKSAALAEIQKKFRCSGE